MRTNLLVAAVLISSAASAQAQKPTEPPKSQPPSTQQPASPPAGTTKGTVQPSPAGATAPMAKLDYMRGAWRGTASGVDRQGKAYQITQTERVGPLLGGEILLVEGRGYGEDGSTRFNAFAVMSWDARAQKYQLRSYAQGMAGTFELQLKEDGYVWETPAGPGAVMRFTATFKDGRWREVGEYIAQGGPPRQTFEMNLTRVGDTDWPQAGPVPPAATQ